jgi:hypothetical protein
MKDTATRPSRALEPALLAPARSPEVPEADDLYGFLVGSWDLDVRRYWVDVADRGLKAEVHCSWVLEGRALQDVWIMPRRPQRTGPPQKDLDMYGTTLRVWDPSIRAWRITWTNPVAGQQVQQIGRRSGRDIVQVGSLPDGSVLRWMFTDITHDSFHWHGQVLGPDAATWNLVGEFLARRAG